jgi:hypothetical protein
MASFLADIHELAIQSKNGLMSVAGLVEGHHSVETTLRSFG